MLQELKFQLSPAILTILTLAAGVSAFINFEQQNHFRLPEDGVVWVDRQGSVEALYVKPGSPGLNAGIHRTDRLLAYFHDVDHMRVVCSHPLPLHVDGDDLGDVSEAVYGVVRDAARILV